MDHAKMGHMPTDETTTKTMSDDMNNMSMGMSMGDGDMPMMMPMYFMADYKGTYVLFKFWKIENAAGLALSFFLVIALGILYEFIKFYSLKLGRDVIMRRTINANHSERQHLAEDNGMNGGDQLPEIQLRINQEIKKISIPHYVLQCLLHALQMTIGYFLMLIAMTYQIYLFLAVILGITIGYGIFHYVFNIYGGSSLTPEARQQAVQTANAGCCD